MPPVAVIGSNTAAPCKHCGRPTVLRLVGLGTPVCARRVNQIRLADRMAVAR